VRTHAASLLLDFQVREHEEALEAFARDVLEPGSDVDGILAFDATDVVLAFSSPADLSRYRDSWLAFYDADLIAYRQERWKREAAEAAERARADRARVKIGRNDPCPCGSGRKHKKCCLGAGR
jgi:hypothetical protein